MKEAGYTWVNPGLFTNGTEDFSSVINQFKAEGCECLTALAQPARFRELLEAGQAARASSRK